MKDSKFIKQKGFTLIELMITIVIVAVLSGITISVINVSQQQNRANDGVDLSTMTKLVQGIEAYHAVEGQYPTSESDPILLNTYINEWPEDVNYWVDTSDYGTIGLAFETAGSEGGYKYRSEWGDIQYCTENWNAQDEACNDIITGVPGSCSSHSECGPCTNPSQYPGCNSGTCGCFDLPSFPCNNDSECAAMYSCFGGTVPVCNDPVAGPGCQCSVFGP